jgi:type II secretory pathway pseudopilin PulG
MKGVEIVPYPNHVSGTRGFTFVEVICVVSFLALGLLALAASIGSGMGTVAVNREEDVAAHAAREELERLQDPAGLPFDRVFAGYNADPEDDPAGYECPGATFEVLGIRDGRGEILFPTADGQLREDVAGRDLNGDRELDEEDHAGDYVLLPVTVRIRWTGTIGARSVEFSTVLASR